MAGNTKRPQQVGQPLDLTDEALDQAADVTLVDVAVARQMWVQHAPPKLADLLDALMEASQG